MCLPAVSALVGVAAQLPVATLMQVSEAFLLVDLMEIADNTCIF